MDLPLVDTLKGMGIVDLFTWGVADLSGIDGEGSLFVSNAVHKAFVSVNELGTEAAAATGIETVPVSAPLYDIDINRPFLFVIRDNETGAFLFIGRVVDPRG